MSAVKPGSDDDRSPWARDDWSSNAEVPQLEALTSPERGAAAPPVAQTPESAPGPPASVDRPSRTQVLLAGAVGIGLLVVGAVAMLRSGDTVGDPDTTIETSVDAAQPSTTSPTRLPPPPTRLPPPPTEVMASTGAPRVSAAPAVVGEVPTWSESTIAVTSPLDGITAPTEVVTLTDDLVLQRIDLPSGRVRSLDLAEWGTDLRIAVSDDSIVVYDNRYVAIIRDDEAIRLFEVPDGVLFVEAWPGTDSLVVTSTGSQTGAADRSVMSTDDGSLRPVAPEVSDALLFGAGNFLSNGDLLVNGPGGIYAIGSDQQPRRIDDGDLLAVGRNHYAVETCDESLQCSTFVVEATTGVRTAAVLDDLSGVGAVDPSTRIAPDGRSIVGTDSTRDTGYRQIIDTATGSRTDIDRLAALYYPDPWAADGSGVFTESAGVLRFQVRDKAETVTLDGVGAVRSFAVRPGG